MHVGLPYDPATRRLFGVPKVSMAFLGACKAEQQVEREREAQWRAELAARPNAVVERVKALQAEQAKHGDDGLSALERAMLADPTSLHNRRLADLEEQRSGTLVRHRIKRGATGDRPGALRSDLRPLE